MDKMKRYPVYEASEGGCGDYVKMCRDKDVAALEKLVAELTDFVWGAACDGKITRSRCAELLGIPLSEVVKKIREMPMTSIEKRMVRLYNQGYKAGHNDTVEGYYTDIFQVDMDTYHSDVVSEILKEDDDG
jgi:hypothetical protein